VARDNSPWDRQRRDLQRKRPQRANHDRILIVSEGRKTEPNYFREIRAHYRLSATSIEVRCSESGTAPIQVVQYARDLFNDGDAHRGIEKRAFERVYAVFDRDDHDSYYDALSLTSSLEGKLKNDLRQPVSFAAIVSVPCFELWLLLHFEAVLSPIHRSEVLSRLKQHLPRYCKGSSDSFSKTLTHLPLAMQRAVKLSQRFNPHTDPEPFTAVADLVQILIGLRPETESS